MAVEVSVLWGLGSVVAFHVVFLCSWNLHVGPRKNIVRAHVSTHICLPCVCLAVGRSAFGDAWVADSASSAAEETTAS